MKGSGEIQARNQRLYNQHKGFMFPGSVPLAIAT
jgi:hypothetical protein